MWDQNPGAGPTPAGKAYTGTPFKINRDYAKRFGDSWVILSAKYGFLRPSDLIPGPYNVTFKQRASQPIAATELRRQVRARRLARFERVIALGGRDYRARVADAFADTGVALASPFAGMSLGVSLAATKRAIALGRPGS